MRGRGSKGVNNGPDGDLLINVRVRAHEFFRRDGTTIHYRLPISFSQAALGDEVEVPILSDDKNAKAKLKIPEGTQTGQIFRMAGKGVPHLNSKVRGDQLVTVTVQTPTGLSTEQRELLRNFAEISGEDSVKKKKKR
jgi:molecular chaperone DnaJ